MTDITPVGSPMFSVDSAARSLMALARQDPSLLSRSRGTAAADHADPLWELPSLFPWRPNLGRPDEAFSEQLYLEELVSIAAEAAERAGDASREAVDATAAVRHGRLAFAVLGVLGMAIGLAAAGGTIWIGEQRQARIAGELAAVQALQRQADRQLAAVASAESRPPPSVQTAAPAALPHLQPLPVTARQEWSGDPLRTPPSSSHASGWTQEHRTPVRRVYLAGPPLILARIVQNIQRDVGALFR